MKIKGNRSFTLSQLTKLDLLVIANALNEYYPRHLNEDSSGHHALNLLNQINDYRDG